ncbi:hypothetical protein MHBO_000744 [Bonamia ostreae]|uniref:Uncharacterized protein n=1 Tax=Bonamia ostreae TaxID=126728 RepID=A0ABV2AHH5_9EUKA
MLNFQNTDSSETSENNGSDLIVYNKQQNFGKLKKWTTEKSAFSDSELSSLKTKRFDLSTDVIPHAKDDFSIDFLRYEKSVRRKKQPSTREKRQVHHNKTKKSSKTKNKKPGKNKESACHKLNCIKNERKKSAKTKSKKHVADLEDDFGLPTLTFLLFANL